MQRSEIIMDPIVTFEHIFKATSNGVIATDIAGKIVLINEQAKKIVGRIPRRVSGTHIRKLMPLTYNHVSICLETGQSQLGRHVRDENISLVVNISPIKEGGRLLGTVCNFQEMKQFEQSAQQLESYRQISRQLETVINSSADGIWVYDGDGNVITINKAALDLDKIKVTDVLGKSIFNLTESGIFDRSVVLEVFEMKRQITILSKALKTDRTLLITGTPILDGRGDISLVVVNLRDMTQLNEVRDQLEQTRMVSEKYRDELAELSLFELSRQSIIAENGAMRQLLRMAVKIAKMEASNILLLGESGTGKGLLAKFIHQNSKRRKKPFIQINCAALPENLLEAELFGYEKGAFTGAREEGKAGLFELARNGTLFLDEIGDLPFSVQAKLLKYLDDHTIMRLGATRTIAIDCIVIAATNRDLESLIKEKKFREDLFYRLNTFTMQIPPLRERPEDIFEMVRHYLEKYNKGYGLKRRISARIMKVLQSYSFPGNVRELKNILKMAVVLSDTDLIDETILRNLEDKTEWPAFTTLEKRNIAGLTQEIMAFEKQILQRTMARCRTTRELAGYLKVSQPTIVRKLKKHGLPGLSQT
jgi:PAS domain S-box-containing protein